MNKPNYVYGLHTISAILNNDPQRIVRLLIQVGRRDARIQSLIDRANSSGIEMQSLPRAALDEFSNHKVHQGIVAELHGARQNVEVKLNELLDSLSEPPFLLVLDGVQDPHNLGACLRSANAAGVHAVIIPKDKSVALTAVVEKVASGAAEVTPLIKVTNLVRTLQELKERGIWVYGASDQAEQSLFAAPLRGAIAWVLGAEGSGLRRLTRETCDVLLSIPMRGIVSSLNVGVAAGICLFETVRQRDFLPGKGK